MKNSKKNIDWKKWQEHLAGFIILGILNLLIYFYYDDIINEEPTGTRGKVLQNLLKSIDESLGKEFVFAFLIVLMIYAGIKALRGYLKR